MPESSIKCPICGRGVAFASPLLPFCSERCRLLDLGNWASGRYQISTPVPEDELDSPLADALDREDGGE